MSTWTCPHDKEVPQLLELHVTGHTGHGARHFAGLLLAGGGLQPLDRGWGALWMWRWGLPSSVDGFHRTQRWLEAMGTLFVKLVFPWQQDILPGGSPNDLANALSRCSTGKNARLWLWFLVFTGLIENIRNHCNKQTTSTELENIAPNMTRAVETTGFSMYIFKYSSTEKATTAPHKATGQNRREPFESNKEWETTSIHMWLPLKISHPHETMKTPRGLHPSKVRNTLRWLHSPHNSLPLSYLPSSKISSLHAPIAGWTSEEFGRGDIVSLKHTNSCRF